MIDISAITPIPDEPNYDWLETVGSIVDCNKCEVEWIVVCSPEEADRLTEMPQINAKVVTIDTTRNVARARNAGLAAASGEYVMQFDSDDIPLLGGLDMMLDSCVKKGACWAGSATEDLWDGDKPEFVFPDSWHDEIPDLIPAGYLIKRRREVRDEDSSRFPVGMSMVHPSAAIVRRDVALAVGGWDEELSHVMDDYAFLAKVNKTRIGAWTNAPSFLYRRHGSQITASSRPDDVWSTIEERLIEIEAL